MERKLLTVPELAQGLKVPKSWIYSQTKMKSGDRIPFIRTGKYLRFEEEKVMEWLHRRFDEGTK